MKTRNKIIMVSVISILRFLFIPYYATHTYCDLFDAANGGCMRISEVGIGELTFYPPIFVFDDSPNCENQCLDLKHHYPPPMDLSAKKDSAWITSAEDELYSIGCDKPILTHLARHSNLLDNEFDGTFSLDWIGLPDGMSKEKFEECVDYILEKRIEEFENEN